MMKIVATNVVASRPTATPTDCNADRLNSDRLQRQPLVPKENEIMTFLQNIQQSIPPFAFNMEMS